jgi:hypothetical protein
LVSGQLVERQLYSGGHKNCHFHLFLDFHDLMDLI